MAKTKTVQRAALKLNYNFNTVSVQAAMVLLFMYICYWVMKPVIEMPPQRDSGCFMYIGQNWLKGMIPYKDMWDHKGPLLYLLNAIGILFYKQKGVMILQIILSSLGFFYLYKTTKEFINHPAAALLSILGFLFIFFLLQSGNQSEQWAIFFQGACLFLYFGLSRNKSTDKKKWIGIGLLLACSFLLRPNQVALWVTIALAELFLLFRNRQTIKDLLFKLVYGLVGFLVPIILFSLYFLYHHAFSQMIDCLFTFNFIYTGDAGASLFDSIWVGVKSVPGFWGVLIAVVVNLIVYIVKFKDVEPDKLFLFLFAVVWLKLEVILSLMAGTNHLHYYLQWILPSLLAIGSFLWALQLLIKDKQNLIYMQILPVLLFCFLMFYKVKPMHALQMNDVEIYKNEYQFREKVVDRIVNETDESDYVLEWGLVDGINFMSERRSPSRYFYPYALDTKGYTSESKVTEFIDEVKARKPKLIIDASKMERFPQIDSLNRDSFYRAKPLMKGRIPANIDEFYRYVESHYRYEGNIGFMLIFKRKE